MMIMKTEKLKWLSDQNASPRRVMDGPPLRSRNQESSTLPIQFPDSPTFILLKNLQCEYDKNELSDILKELTKCYLKIKTNFPTDFYGVFHFH